jgi:parvulin-like peptidyl-prolyl isomerase
MSRIVSFLRQPLLHFLLIGAAVFAVYDALDNSASTGSAQEEIVISDATVAQLAANFQSVWSRAPTPDELGNLVEDLIKEEVLTREAIALSLDRNDAVIRRRLRQKMEFLTDSAAAALNPSDEELRALFDAEPGRYASNQRVAFDQVFVGDNPDAGAIEKVREALRSGADPASIGAITLLPQSLPLSASSSVEGMFGRGFFDALVEAEVGDWSGPVKSGYGVHFIRITDRSDAAIPDFESVHEAVLRDWIEAKAKEIADAQYQRLLSRYTVRRPDLSFSNAQPQ